MRSLSILLCVAAAVPAAAQSGITRENEFWVRTVTGAEMFPAKARLHVETRGDVAVSGAAPARVSWELKARAKAGSETEARRLLDAVTVRLSRSAGQHILAVERPGEVETALKLLVPSGLPALAVVTREGRVEASGLAGQISLASGGGEIRADRLEGSLEARTGGGPIVLGYIRGSAQCATGGGNISARSIGGEAVLQTGGGNVDVGEVRGHAQVDTAGGRVHIGRAGSVTASSGGGRVEVGQASGPVELRNAAGAIHVGAAKGVRCELGTGTIRLSNVSGALRASTAMGSIMAQLVAGGALDDSFLTTGGGDITVLIPSNLGVKIHAANGAPGGSRRIVSDFPEISTQVRGVQVVAEGDINGGGPLLRIAGAGGTIFIKRK